MARTIEQELTDRFIAAIKKSFEPCPLIGPKWFRFHPRKSTWDFVFVGLPKLAKAGGKKLNITSVMIRKNVNLTGLPIAETKFDEDGKVYIRFQKPAPAASPEVSAPSPNE